MNDIELKNIWQTYDRKLNHLLEVNFQQLKTIKGDKAESKIRSFIHGHMVGVVLGIIWILFLGFLVFHMLDNIYFTLSVSLIILFNIFAVAAYIRHVNILQQINIGESIMETQRKLALVITSDKQVARILILQTPFYCTFYYSDQLVHQAGPLFWTIQLIVVTLLTTLAVYGYIKLSPASKPTASGKFINTLFGTPKLQKASAFLNEIEEFKKEI
jgi:hypothetical protein